MYPSNRLNTNPSPYRIPSDAECFLNLRTGAVACVSNESSGGLPRPSTPSLPSSSLPSSSSSSCGSGLGPGLDLELDSPLNRILQREPVGPWTAVGYVTSDEADALQSRDRAMTLHAQTVDTRRDRYNYRVTNSNGVALDLGDKVDWIMEGTTVSVPGQISTYTVHLYQKFR